MTFKVTTMRGDIARIQSDAAIVNLFEGVDRPGGATGAVDQALVGLITDLIADGEITGKRGNNVLIHTPSGRYGEFAPKRVLVVGLGTRSGFGIDDVREIAAGAVTSLQGVATTATTIVHGSGIGGLDTEVAARAMAEGSIVGHYSFNKYKNSSNNPDRRLGALNIVEFDDSKVPQVRSGVAIGDQRGRSAELR